MQQRVFITGGASGIGRQLARDYVADGWQVCLFDRQPATAVVAELGRQTAGARVESRVLEVTDGAAVSRAFAAAAEGGAPRRVIHCAGIAEARAFVDTPAERFDQVVAVNLLGSAHVARAAVACLPPGGHLVLVASMAGLLGCYGYSAYGASKHGVVGLAEVLRIELRARGIDVSVVCPPEVETPMVVAERLSRPRATEAMKLMAGTLSVEAAARAIRQGIDRRHFLIIPGQRAQGVWLASRYLPGALSRALSDAVLRRVQRQEGQA